LHFEALSKNKSRNRLLRAQQVKDAVPGQHSLRDKDRNSRAKLVAGWTGANERTVKNWFSGRYAPCGRHLVVLAHHSDQVLNAILLMADRQDRLLGEKVEDLRRKVLELAAIIGEPPLLAQSCDVDETAFSK
jgi:hypothetical protein